MSKNYYENKQNDKYFGIDNWKRHRDKTTSYKAVLSDNIIILRTNNVITIKNEKEKTISYALTVFDDKVVYLQPWQIKRISYVDRNKQTVRSYLVKLNREFFKPHYLEIEKLNTHFYTEDDFDSLLEEAKSQQILSVPVKI